MGTNSGPLVADLFLFCYERDFMKSLPPENQIDIIEAFNIGIKHDFPFINIRKVPREMLKTSGEVSRGTLRMLMNDKIMFDRYYCINSKKTHRTLRKCLSTLFFSLTTIFLHAHAFYKYPRFGPWPDTFSHDDLKA